MTNPGTVPTPNDFPELEEWRSLHIDQHPQWAEHPDFTAVINELNSVPPLVFAGEVDQMRADLARLLAAGRRLRRNFCWCYRR